MNDGSTDQTGAILRRLARDDPRIRVFEQPHCGVAVARNEAIRRCSGELIAPLDADDLWHPQKIERQLRRLQSIPHADLVYSPYYEIDEYDNILRPIHSPGFEGDTLAALVMFNFVGNASNPLIRRECLEATGGYDSTLRSASAEGCEDYKLYLEIACRSNFAFIPDYLVGYRIHKGSMSWNYRQMIKSHQIVLQECRKRWPDLPEEIFRWSEARVKAGWGFRAAATGHWLDGLRLIASAMCRYPPVMERIANTLQRWTLERNPPARFFGQIAAEMPERQQRFEPDYPTELLSSAKRRICAQTG
jgi:glycosyltransferase involved in cell wall biosynthesis